jgi:hypothetical protein
MASLMDVGDDTCFVVWHSRGLLSDVLLSKALLSEVLLSEALPFQALLWLPKQVPGQRCGLHVVRCQAPFPLHALALPSTVAVARTTPNPTER